MPGPLDQNSKTVVEAIDNDVSSPDPQDDLYHWQQAHARTLETHHDNYLIASLGARYSRIQPSDRIRPNRTFPQEKFFLNTSSKECPINPDQSRTPPTLETVTVSYFSLFSRSKWAGMESKDLRELTRPVQHPLDGSDSHRALDNLWIRSTTGDSTNQIDSDDFQEGDCVATRCISNHISDGRFSGDKPDNMIHRTLRTLGLESYVSSIHRTISSYCRGWLGQRNMYTSSGKGDNVKCWYCDGGFNYWDYGDVPWVEHAKWFSIFQSHNWQLLFATTTGCDATSHQPIQWARHYYLNTAKMKQPNISEGGRQAAILPLEQADDPDGIKTEKPEIYEEGGYIENLAPPTGGEDGENDLANIPGTSGVASSNQALRRPLNLQPGGRNLHLNYQTRLETFFGVPHFLSQPDPSVDDVARTGFICVGDEIVCPECYECHPFAILADNNLHRVILHRDGCTFQNRRLCRRCTECPRGTDENTLYVRTNQPKAFSEIQLSGSNVTPDPNPRAFCSWQCVTCRIEIEYFPHRDTCTRCSGQMCDTCVRQMRHHDH